MRTATIKRETRETRLQVDLQLEGKGKADVTTGIGFFDHMLEQLAYHGGFDIKVACTGDLHVDGHHTVEDVGIALGKAFREALGDCAGIARYGHAIIPMDEALVLCAVDVSGRGMCEASLPIPVEKVGSFDTELVAEFLRAFAVNAGITLHVRMLAGVNGHHIIEAAFKALARATSMAVGVNDRRAGVPSTKGLV